MKNIKKIINSEAAYEILDNSNCAGSTWTSGGCAILASALNKLEGYPIYVIFNKNFRSPEHFGVMTPSGSILDADGEHKNSKSWINFLKNNEILRPGELVVYPYISGMKLDGVKLDDEASDKLAELIRNYQMIREMVRQVLKEGEMFANKTSNNLLIDFKNYIDLVFNSVNEDDEPSPTFEWDIAKEKLDNSMSFVKTKEQAQEYLVRVLEKIQPIPRAIKIKIVKYLVFTLVGLMGYSAIKDVVYDSAPEISQEIGKAMVAVSANKNAVDFKKKVELAKEPRKSSETLKNILKHEEGSIQEKGEPVLKAYKLGDGMITVGWGHAERIGHSQFRPGQEISREKAEELLDADIAEAERGLNIILDNWKEEGVNVKITQPMYDAMVSMIFNMGIGNFRKSDFIQLLKRGKYIKAKEKILSTNVTYPGHVPRRQKESELFGRGIPV